MLVVLEMVMVKLSELACAVTVIESDEVGGFVLILEADVVVPIAAVLEVIEAAELTPFVLVMMPKELADADVGEVLIALVGVIWTVDPAEFVVTEVVAEFVTVPEVDTVFPALSVVVYAPVDANVGPTPDVTIVLPALFVVVYV